MKKSKDNPAPDKQAAAVRIADLEEKFHTSSITLSTLIAGIGQTDGQTPKAVMSKLMELETVHTTILRSQEAFHEKYKIPIPRVASTTMQSALTLGANLIASAPRLKQTAFLKSLDDQTLQALPYLFEFWAMPHQVPPAGDWRTWVILGGAWCG